MIVYIKLFNLTKGLFPMVLFMASLLIALITILPVSFADVILQPGREELPFSLEDTAGKVYRLVNKAADTVLMVFAKNPRVVTPQQHSEH